MTILTVLPDAPSTSDPTNFAAKADALLAALATLVSEINAAGGVNVGNATTLLGETWSDRHVISTPQASTSGTAIDFTGIPSWAKKITINLSGVSTSGISNLLIQIGDSGGVETTGYLGSGCSVVGGTAANYTAGFGFETANAANVIHGSIVLSLENSSAFTWAAVGMLGLSSAAQVLLTSGAKSLSAALDRVRITTANGTDAFDAGEINISYE